MTIIREAFYAVDDRIVRWMSRYGLMLLRLSVGIVFLWFGGLKFFPGLSPAEGIASRTISMLSFGLIVPRTAVLILAVWESLIGVGLILNLFMRGTLFLLYLQMLGTLTPLFLLPGEVFIRAPYAPTLEGQYIIKNLVLISAGIVLGATVRGGELIPDSKDVGPRSLGEPTS